MKASSQPVLKIAFQFMGNDEWYAGISYLKSFLFNISQTYRDNVKICLLVKDVATVPAYEMDNLADETIVMPSFFGGTPSKRWTVSWLIKGIKTKLMYHLFYRRGEFFKRRGIDVVFGLGISERYGHVTTLSWVWDFQHVRLPHLFSLEERASRDKHLRRIAESADRIVVMSEDVKKDFEAFAPSYGYKIRVLKTASYIPASIYQIDPKLTAAFYHLPEKFIYLPSQFWKHKNHPIVFEAIKELKERGTIIVVVCSGFTSDYRHPAYLDELIRKVSELGIRDQIIFLGLVPRDHVFQLIRQSICVLCPSLFEGFGLSVDEARGVGKRVLLSDIPAHREQNPPKAVFFNPHDCGDLAQKLNQVWLESIFGPDFELEKEARASLPERIRSSAESFMLVVREIVAES